MKRVLIEIFKLFCLCIIVISCKTKVADTTQGPPRDRIWTMVWNDEFDGTSFDTTKWFPSGGGWNLPDIKTESSNQSLYQDGKGNLILRVSKKEDGTLLYHNGLTTYYEKAYGYFEARVQFSTEPGWWTAFWLSGYPYGEGDDCFTYPQEFDIYEDFYKPKKENDIQQCYHANAGLLQGVETGEYGKENMIDVNEVRRHSLPKKYILDKYEGWHTVALEWTPLEHIFYVDGKENFRMDYRECPITNVPQKLWLSGCYRTPKDSADAFFYGLAKYGNWPDQVVFDYVRVYEQDWGDKSAPEVKVELMGSETNFKKGDSVKFSVKARDNDGRIQTIYLFSKGRIRAEFSIDSPETEHIFEISNLFKGENTIIAMAKDNDGRVGQSEIIRVNISE